MQHERLSLVGVHPAVIMAAPARSSSGGNSSNLGDETLAMCIAAAERGDVSACFDLGVAYSTGSHGLECDLIEAHKWFNLAAVGGHDEAAPCRHDVAEEMTAREVAEAQRRAREWTIAMRRQAA